MLQLTNFGNTVILGRFGSFEHALHAIHCKLLQAEDMSVNHGICHSDITRLLNQSQQMKLNEHALPQSIFGSDTFIHSYALVAVVCVT